MRKLSLTLFSVAVAASVTGAACGSDSASQSDAKVADAKPIDAKVFLDANGSGSGSGSANYDFSCYGHTAPATAADPITIAGTTQSISTSGFANLAGVQVQTFKAGTSTAVDTKTSDANGAFTTGNIVTTAVPLDGYLLATLTAYRPTYVYPPNKAAANLTGVPVPLISDSTFTQLNSLVLHQDDTSNGLLFITVTDCTLTPVAGTTLSVKQNGAEVGMQMELSDLGLMGYDGIYFVSNVPDGTTTISATYNAMTFPAHDVVAHKKPTTTNGDGSVTVSAVVPGFF